ncbi:Protein of unknown function [Aquimarina amphilecti]|uniref:DUF3999 domain-containing protein n=1 Tax=Aquimarina amphilecti TaxID=1038014 RepID=A0A1H7TI72_AQUAM|nr:DUF3999 family protein [Aquimarina amphilecti]SEL83517.1 Protein of unknown function [Aquimarina amphilecti]
MKLKINIVQWLLFLVCLQTYAQIDKYAYKRELLDVSDDWHAIVLPDAIFKNVSSDLSDIRIYGITKETDTVEAPYLLEQKKPKISSKNIGFKYVNKSTTNKGSFITFKVTLDAVINQVQLSFEQDNFDRLIKVEGSQNLKDWYTVVDDYRVLSVKNELTEYSFTTLKFPDSKYTYYRVFVKGKDAPDVKKAEITLKEKQEGSYKRFTVKAIKTIEQNKSTILTIDLDTPVPVSYMKIKANNTFDYYRPFRVTYLRDSIHRESGWKYDYQHMTSGILNSIEENEFNFYSTITNKIKIVVNNQDNEPLDIDEVLIKGFDYELITRFNTSANYFLTYGNKGISKPSYDLQYMTERVPEKLVKLKLGAEQIIPKNEKETIEPLFENKIWLWGIMLVIIGLLGGFTLMMMKKK